MKKVTKQEHIDEILDQFDFETVRKVMVALGWTWSSTDGQVPDIYNLRKVARDLLQRCANTESKNYFYSTGGFSAEKQDGDTLILEFVVSDWSTWDSFDPQKTEISWD